MKHHLPWSRRDFLQMIGCSSLVGMGARLAWLTGSSECKNKARFAYAGFGERDQPGGIQVFAVEGDRWRAVQSIESPLPTFLALHPNQRFLYAVHEIDSFENLPLGAVDAFAIDSGTGQLTLLNRQPLSLSATLPRHMAIAPDGSSVVVAVHGGGAYNVLPIGRDGALGRVSGIFKETGSSVDGEFQRSAHPQMVLFDSTGHRLLGADLGGDRLSVFHLTEGQLALQGRSSCRVGSGPRHMELHPNGRLLFVANGLEASIGSYEYDQREGRIGKQLAHTSTGPRKASVIMAMHPSGRFLYTANHYENSKSLDRGIAVWKISEGSGTLAPIEVAGEKLPDIHAMSVSPHGDDLLLVARNDGAVFKLRLDFESGRVEGIARVATLPAPTSVAMKYL